MILLKKAGIFAMLDIVCSLTTRFSKSIVVIVLGLTVFFAMQLEKLHWETDARVYMPKGHPAIIYDEKVEETFGVKNAVIIGIVNKEKGVYNPETLARIARITEQVANLPGVVANRTIDVMSISTASAFIGDEESESPCGLGGSPCGLTNESPCGLDGSPCGL